MPTESSIESPTEGIAAATPTAGPGDRPLLEGLAQALQRDGVVYCRLGAGGNLDAEDRVTDVDLLVGRPHMQRLAELLFRLGFKAALASPNREAPGALVAYADDAEVGGLIRVRAHHHLLVGHGPTIDYRLPVEAHLLNSAIQDGAFRVPSPEYDLVVFVLRAVLQRRAPGRGWRAQVGSRLAALRARSRVEKVRDLLRGDLAHLGERVFDDCLRALRPSASRFELFRAALRVRSGLGDQVRRPLAIRVAEELWRGAAWAGQRALSRPPAGHRLHSGGAIIAVVGGDGAGKSTVVDGLRAWLSRDFVTSSVHLGKPAWSWTTATIRGLLKLGQLCGLYPLESSFRRTLSQRSLVSTGYPWMLREVCRARDRYTTYARARRLAINGSLVISDRYPLAQIRVMDGPQIPRFLEQPRDGPEKSWFNPRPGDRLVRALTRLEESYYRRIAPPEVLIVLRVAPEIAVQRRSGEDSVPVRERSSEIWQIDWRGTKAHIVDAGRSKDDVLAQAKATVWSEL